MNHEEVYERKIHHKGFSVFSCGETTEGHIDIDEMKEGILRAFVEDLDVQEITITSTNIGFSRTYRKHYKNRKSATPDMPRTSGAGSVTSGKEGS